MDQITRKPLRSNYTLTTWTGRMVSTSANHGSLLSTPWKRKPLPQKRCLSQSECYASTRPLQDTDLPWPIPFLSPTPSKLFNSFIYAISPSIFPIYFYSLCLLLSSLFFPCQNSFFPSLHVRPISIICISLVLKYLILYYFIFIYSLSSIFPFI
jgi:hypothetical protein